MSYKLRGGVINWGLVLLLLDLSFLASIGGGGGVPLESGRGTIVLHIFR